MATETIDELIVKFGLDPTQFTAGQKAAADSLQSMRASVGEAAEGMGASLGALAAKFSGFFLGFAGIAGAIDLVKNMAFELKNLGIQAQTLGTTGSTLRAMQEVGELAGAPSNAIAAYAQSGLSSIYGAVYGGIPQWAAPAMIGYSHPLAFWAQLAGAKTPQQEKAVYMGLSQHLQTSPQAARFGESMGLSKQAAIVQFAEQVLKINPAIAVLLTNTKQLGEYFDRSAKDNQSIHQRQIEAATKLANSMITLKYRVENEATTGFPLLSIGLKIATASLNVLSMVIGEVSKIFDDIANSPLAKWIEKEFEPNKPNLLSTINTVRHTEHQALLAAGKSILHGAEAATHWMSASSASAWKAGTAIEGALGMRGPNGSFPGYDPADLTPPALHAAPFTPISLPMSLSLPSISLGGAATHDNSLTMGNVTVHAPTGDAHRIVQSLQSAIQRKFNVTQADSGVVV